MPTAISIQGIYKSYKSVDALTDIRFDVNEGELFGLIGPDGAGKTSLIRILATLLLPTKGTAEVSGWNIHKGFRHIRQHIGYMPGVFALYQDLTVAENLHFFATVFDSTIEENYDLIAPIYEQIEPFRDRRAGKLSGGMKQKLALSCALIHRPKVLFLDEPTTGVDAVSRQEFWDMLRDMKKHGITVFVSTPYMDEADLCDRVALIQKGKILDIDTPANIVSHFKRKLFRVRSRERYRLLQDLRANEHIDSAYPFGAFTHVTLKTEQLPASDLLQYLESLGHEELVVEPAVAGIEDRFIDLMKNH
jgi:ABC-type multidrug transport system ATPase subunit